MERLRHLAGSLIQSPKTGDVSKVRDILEKLEQNWQDLEDTLSDKRKEAGMREEQSSRFEDMKDAVLRWLTYMENRLDDLEPVAIDVEIIEKQIEEIEVSSVQISAKAHILFATNRNLFLVFNNQYVSDFTFLVKT